MNTDIQSDLVAILHASLGLPDGSIAAHPDTRLLGAVPEMDSMAVVSILMTLEERYGISVDDDEVSAEEFATLGSLTRFVELKID